MGKLDFLTEKMGEARDALQEALRSADSLNLDGTCVEIHRALSHVGSVIYEIERKLEPEFAAFRSPQETNND